MSENENDKTKLQQFFETKLLGQILYQLFLYAMFALSFLILIYITYILFQLTKNLELPDLLKKNIPYLITIFSIYLLVHFICFSFIITFKRSEKESKNGPKAENEANKPDLNNGVLEPAKIEPAASLPSTQGNVDVKSKTSENG